MKVAENRKKTEMRSYEDSAKSKKTIASMIENNNQNNQQQASSSSGGAKASAKVIVSYQLSYSEFFFTDWIPFFRARRPAPPPPPLPTRPTLTPEAEEE